MLMNIDNILQLSTAEKILIVEKIWDNIAEENAKMPVPKWKKELIKERVIDHKKNPSTGTDWDTLKKKYFSR